MADKFYFEIFARTKNNCYICSTKPTIMKKSTLTIIQVLFWISTFLFFYSAAASVSAVAHAGYEDELLAVISAGKNFGTAFIVAGISTAVHAACKYFKSKIEKGSI